MAEQNQDPWIPAYTVTRRKATGKERRRDATKRAAEAAGASAAVSAAATAALTRSPRAAARAAGIGAAGGAVLGAATAPKHRYEMRRIHGLSARPTAPGERPQVFMRETTKEADVSKANAFGVVHPA